MAKSKTPLPIAIPETNGVAKSKSEVTPSGGVIDSPVTYRACLYSNAGKNNNVPVEFAKIILDLENKLGMHVWCIIQNGQEEMPWASMDPILFQHFARKKQELQGKPIAILLHSYGGLAQPSFQLSEFLRRVSSEFVVLVPQLAKSAATLFSLGANKIYLADDAHLGPLDVQQYDLDSASRTSALNEVQALEGLFLQANVFTWTAATFWQQTTGLKYSELLPVAVDLVGTMLAPIVKKVDTIHLTKSSRDLKVGEEYAIRLLRNNYPEERAKQIAHKLVHNYPEHGFVINRKEMAALGFKPEILPEGVGEILESVLPFLNNFNIVGRIQPISSNETPRR